MGEIPEDVLRFLSENIDTVPHLEALLLMAESPAEWWTDDSLAARIYSTREAAAVLLKDLAHRRLVRAENVTSLRYQYDASWDTAGLMPEVMIAYRRQLIRVATFIHSKGSASVREFARAFDLKKER